MFLLTTLSTVVCIMQFLHDYLLFIVPIQPMTAKH